MGCRRPEREYGGVCAFFFTQLVSADSPIEEVVKSNSYKPINYRIMRKFKLLFVVLVASIFFMPSELFAQSNELEELHSMQEQYRNMKRSFNSEKDNLPPNIVQRRQAQLSEMEQNIKALEQKLNANGVETQTPTFLGEQILATIKNPNASFSEEENIINTLLSLDKSDERKSALLKVYNSLIEYSSAIFDSSMLGFKGHKGTERGNKEIELAEQIKKRMNDEGDKTFGLLPGQREDDIVVRTADERVLGAGTKIRRKNGVLTVNNYGGMTLTMDDGTVFNGYFKEQVNFYGDSNQYGHLEQFADAKLLLAEEFTPYDGVIQYADGKSDKLNMGKSVTAQVKAAKAAYEAEMKAVKSELAKLSQKYGAATINSLKTTGALKVGYSMTMLNDYLKVCNRYRSALAKANNGQDDPLGFHYFEPTVSEVLKYGKTANRVKLGGTKFANEWVLANCMVANGKIAAIYQNTTILAIKDL